MFELYKKAYPYHTVQKVNIQARQLWKFINLKPGEKIVTNQGRKLLLGLAEVKGGYKFDGLSPNKSGGQVL